MTIAQAYNEHRELFPTNLSSADIAKLDAQIVRQSVLSARMTSATVLQAIKDALRSMLAAHDGVSANNAAEARLQLKFLGQELGYDPAKGFPGEATVPPAEPGSITDIFSTDRLNLILKTQQMLAQGAAKNIWGNEPDALEQYPAWELVRVAAVDVPRGERRVKGGFVNEPENAWDTENGRWPAACYESGDDDAAKIFDDTGRMVARKDSPVWASLGGGAGGYDDALGNDYEPFAFNSGMGRVEVSAHEFKALGGNADGLEASDTDFGSGEVKIKSDRFDPDILKSFIAGMDSGDIKYRVHVEVIK